MDTQGLVLGVKVLPAHLTDAEGGRALLGEVGGRFQRLSHLFVDGWYKRGFGEWVRGRLGWTMEVVRRPGAGLRGIWWPEGRPMPKGLEERFLKGRGFVVLPRRWVVERTFAPLSFSRRLNRDYGLLPEI